MSVAMVGGLPCPPPSRPNAWPSGPPSALYFSQAVARERIQKTSGHRSPTRWLRVPAVRVSPQIHTSDVRLGSLADISAVISDVSFPPKSGVAQRRDQCLLSAISGHPQSMSITRCTNQTAAREPMPYPTAVRTLGRSNSKAILTTAINPRTARTNIT